MFNNNTSYQEAINAPSRRITGNVTIKGQKLSDDISSIDYVSSISGNTLTIGATNASTVDIKFKRLIEGLEEKELIKVSFSVQTSSGIIERQIGEFFLTEIKLDRNNKTTTLKAIDKMAFLNDKYTSTLLYPTLGRNIVQEIANSCNLRVNNNLNITSLPSFSKKLEKVTYREMLGYLAQTVGAFVIFNNNGELEFRKLNRTQKQISKGSYLLKGLEVDEVEYRINGISISLNNQEKTILAVGSPLGTQVKLTNPLMTQGWLNSIFSEYSKLRFNPFKLNWRGDPFVEVGDWVSIEIANGSYRAFPILELKLSYSGGLKSTIGANVKGTTTSTTEYKGTVERQIEFINARLGASGNYVYADTVEPTNPKEGDTWFKPNGAFTDLYIYENNQWVLKTSTGNIEGLITKITDSSVSTQNLATAIAKIIELDAARITTGSLSFEQLNSNAVSEIRKGMVSETKFNSFVNDSNGLRQQMSSEIEKVVESKKSTLKGQDGVSSYIHRKYSDNANGTPMSDNSTLKYIGIYTGDKQQAPTNASEYSWTKIRGEDGKSINRNYITDSKNLNNKVFYSWNKWDKSVEGDTLVLTKVGGSDTYGFYFNLTDLVKTQFQNESLTWSIEIKASRNMTLRNVGFETNGLKQVDITTEWQKISHTFINKFTNVFAFVFYNSTANFNNGDKIYIRLPKLEKGNVATEWIPAYEDLQGHSLTANVRFEGTYINNITNNVRIFAEVYYDGQKVTNGYNLKIKHKGGNNTQWGAFYTRNYTEQGEVLQYDWGNKEQNGTPLEVVVLIDYKGMSTVATARMENVPDIVEIKEITKKYKTFESTIDRFDSTIGEVKKQVLANEEKRNLIIGSRLLNASDYSVNGKVWDAESKQGIYTQIRQSTGDGVNTIYNGNSYVFAVAQNNTQNVWQGIKFNISSKLLLPGRQYSLSIPYYILGGFPPDKGIFAEIKNHNTGRVVWREELTSTPGYQGAWIEKKATFRTDRTEYLSDYSFWIYAVQNGGFCISTPYMCEGDVLPKTYSPAPEDVHLQNSRIESSIKQTKDEIDLKVSKDNVINAINISSEGTKITGTAIADYLYGKTIEGAVIQGNSKIKIGKHGYMIPAGEGLRFCLPEKPDANKGVGVQMLGNYGRDGDTAYGFYLYVDPDFDAVKTAETDAYLMTVNGYISTKGVNNLKFQNYTDNSTAIGIWDKNVALLFDRTKNDIYYDWGGKIYSLWQMIDRFYSTTSDVRLKKDIKTCKYKALDLIGDFKFKSFNWKHREQLERKPFTEIGLIAQDVEKINKNFVSMAGEYKTLNQFNLLTYSLKAIQELSQENTNLKSQLKAMNERLTKLEDKINGNL